LYFNWLNPKAQIKTISDKGIGSFAQEVIYRGEVVASFGGYVVKASYLKNYSQDRASRSIQASQNLYLLSGAEPEPGDMLNHSCNPNCGAFGISTIVAMKQIEVTEEITFDYAMTDATAYDEFDCFCGESNCRKRITGNDWQIQDIQEKYKGFFSSNVEKLILNLRKN
jgi:hypothetical protein